MSAATAKLAEYNRNAILSATPTQIVTMLYDRLVLDLKRAEAAQETGEWDTAREQLLHAQDIVNELSASLKLDVWDGAARLLAIYTYVRSALISANINRDIARTREAIGLIEPLRQSWHDAAAALSVSSTGVGGELGVG